PDRLWADDPRRNGAFLPRLLLETLFCRGRRADGDARKDGRDPGYRGGGNPRYPAPRPCRRGPWPYPVADDCSAHPEGLDRAEGGGRQADRRDLPRPSGADRPDGWHPEPGRAYGPAGRMAAQLQAG